MFIVNRFGETNSGVKTAHIYVPQFEPMVKEMFGIDTVSEEMPFCDAEFRRQAGMLPADWCFLWHLHDIYCCAVPEDVYGTLVYLARMPEPKRGDKRGPAELLLQCEIILTSQEMDKWLPILKAMGWETDDLEECDKEVWVNGGWEKVAGIRVWLSRNVIKEGLTPEKAMEKGAALLNVLAAWGVEG